MKRKQQVQLAKKQLCTCSTLFCTFLYCCFARLQPETSRNFLVTHSWRKCHTCSCSFFFHCGSFSCTLVATSISYFPATTKFQQKNVSFVFYLSLFFLLSFAGLLPTFSFSLSLSFSVFQICGHNNIY